MSLLDDFENSFAQTPFEPEPAEEEVEEEAIDTGFLDVTVDFEGERPIFVLNKVVYTPPSSLRALSVNNNILVMGQENGHIVIIDLKQPENLFDIEVIKTPGVSIHKLFIDPNGKHILISTTSGENYYLHYGWRKTRPLPKLKGHIINSIAWNSEGTEFSTGNFLAGTTSGEILSICLEPRDKATKMEEKLTRTVFTLPEKEEISGLALEVFPGVTLTADDQTGPKYFVLAATPLRIYQFNGGPTFELLFEPYEKSCGFTEIPGDLVHSQLSLSRRQLGALPESFAWLTWQGIYHGGLTFGSQTHTESVLTDPALLHFNSAEDASEEQPNVVAFLTTPHHCLLVRPSGIQAICTVNEQVVFEEGLRDGLCGCAKDETTGTMWVFSQGQVYEIQAIDEDRHIWRLYLEKGDFSSALSHANTVQQKDTIYSTQADELYSRGQAELAAKQYARTQRPFEEISLRFVAAGQQGALKTYLLSKLDLLADSELTQRTVVATWLTEIYLDKLVELKTAGPACFEPHAELRAEFLQFLKDAAENLDVKTTYDLIQSHGCIEELLDYARLVGDYDRVLAHLVQKSEYLEALDTLLCQDSTALYYKHIPAILPHEPVKTVDALIRTKQPLDARKLLPALMIYDNELSKKQDKEKASPVIDPNGKAKSSLMAVNQAIRYLQHAIFELHCTDPAVHNYLLTVFARDAPDSQLMAFLSAEESFYDAKYALRTCLKEARVGPSVFLYCKMGMFTEAVELALTRDMQLAKESADMPEDDPELRKKLWLRIAKHVVQQNNDIKQATDFVRECELLRIEDVLPFFPDFVKIDDFKDEICAALEEYNRHIDELKAQMEDATRSADRIRSDVRDLRSRFSWLSLDQRCECCDYPVLTRKFYLFPCQHAFHSDCVIKMSEPFMNAGDRTRLAVLMRTLDSSLGSADQAQAQAALDSFLSADCPLCGSAMIRSTNTPFVGHQSEDLKEVTSWRI